ncbi:MAG: spore maturation protein [Firmicutes bacterium]|nr:spore maturation protein [Bacillota bacterium]
MLFRAATFVAVWLVPLLIAAAIIGSLRMRVNLFDRFIEGAREGFAISVRLIPYLVAMLVAISLFQESGAMEILARGLAPLLERLKIPAEVLPLAVMRPLSGSASLAIGVDIMSRQGADTLIGRIASTMIGSTETTLYILTVYFGAVGVYRSRHALPTGLLADLGGFVAAVVVCRLIFG